MNDVPVWVDVARQAHQAKIAALLRTFDVPRKAYLKSAEWVTVSNLWRMHWLNAGETGSDTNGEYQVFSLSESGRRIAETE